MVISPIQPISSRNIDATESASQVLRKDHTIVEMGDCTSSQNIDKVLTLQLENPDELATEISAPETRIMLENFDQILGEIITDLSVSSSVNGQELLRTIELAMDGDINGAKGNAAPESMAEFIAITIDELDLPTKTEQSPAATLQRAQIIVDSIGDLLGKLGRNEFEGNLGRWASNLTISGLRTGLVAASLTPIRQLIGFALEKSYQSNGAPLLTRNVIGAMSMMIGPALNILGAIRDECKGTANTQTRLARFATLTLSMAALAAAATVPQALSALASFGPQTNFYSLATELINLCQPIGDNSQANPVGTIATGGVNGPLQFLAFTAMNYTAPKSGPGYVMSAGSAPSTADDVLAVQLLEWMERTGSGDAHQSPESRATDILASLEPVLGHDFLRGAYNALADVASQVFGGEIMHAFQTKKAADGFRVKLTPPRIPTMEQVTNQFLTTNAIRTSMSASIIAIVISASRYFSTLPISKAQVDHAVNALVAATVFAGRMGVVYADQGTKPATTQQV